MSAPPPQTFLVRHGRCLAAIAMIATAYGFAVLPDLPRAERASMAARFQFETAALPTLPGATPRSVRDVNPSLEHISGWISSVGAAVALHDLDGDGLPNDVAYVDPRTDQAIVCAAPGTPARYAPFALDPAPLPYDRATMAPMGCLPGDFDEDGHADVLVYYWGRTPVVFLGGPGAGLDGAHYTPVELAATPERWYTNAATQADLDGDGHVDLVFGNYFSEDERILDAHATTTDHMQHSMSRAFNGGRNRLLLWTPPATGARIGFHPVDDAMAADVAHAWTLAVGAQDLDGDLLPEIYFANDFGPDRLLHNLSTPGHLKFALLRGIKHFATPNSKRLGGDSFKGMGVDFGDVNGDGLPDIYVSNIAATWALEESHFLWASNGATARMKDGVAPYDDASEPLGLARSSWGWDARLDDFDNDGTLEALQATGFLRGDHDRWPELQELAIGNDDLLEHAKVWPRFQPGDDLCGHAHAPFFVRAKSGRFFDLAADIGLGQPAVSRGIATADVDGDGNLDWAVANQWETSYLHRNRAPHPGAFLGLHLVLPRDPATPFTQRAGHPGADTPGSPAIGAQAFVKLPNGRQLAAQVDGGNGHSGKRSPDVHFGLGATPPNAMLHLHLMWRDRSGEVGHYMGMITPGWHTIVLGKVQPS